VRLPCRLEEIIRLLELGTPARPAEMSSRTVKGISIDSRTIEAGELFIAVEGKRFDGHEFAGAALAKGAVAAIVRKDWLEKRGKAGFESYLGVGDTLDALARMAQAVRREFGGLVIAVTGSNGKTTTKELIGCLLRGTMETVVAPASWNNRIGVPLTLFLIREHHRAVVLEMGMNAPGEIEYLSRISSPGMAVLTNVGQAHIGSFDSLEGIAREKAALARSVPPSGAVILNGDDPYLRSLGEELDVETVFFGLREGNSVRPVEWWDEGLAGIGLVLDGEKFEVPLLGRHNVYNVLAAWAVGGYLGLDRKRMAADLSKIPRLPSRLEVLDVAGVTVLNDTYNANPVSMRAALEVSIGLPVKGKRYALIGDMLELGDWAREAHTELGRMIAAGGFAGCFLVGGFAEVVRSDLEAAGGKVLFCGPEPEGVAEALAERLAPGDLLLAKASRAVGLERVVTKLRRLLSAAESPPRERGASDGKEGG